MSVDFTYTPISNVNAIIINNNFQKVQEALADALGRKGKTPNQMEVDIDLNGNDVINVGGVYADDYFLDGTSLNTKLEEAIQASAQAVESAEQAAEIVNSIAGSYLSSDITINIPSDFPTLQEAFDEYVSIQPNGYRKILNIESGHKLTKGLSVGYGDFVHYKVVSEDSVVLLDENFVPVQPPGPLSFTPSQNCVFFGLNCVAPEWDILIDAEEADVCAYHLYNSSGRVLSGKGVNNANRMGIVCSTTSKLTAEDSSFQNTGEGNRINQSSVFHGRGIDLSGYRALSGEPTRAALEVSRGCVVNISSNEVQTKANLSNSAADAIFARRSIVFATNVDMNDAANTGIRADLGSYVSAPGANLDGCGNRAVKADTGSHVVVSNGELTNAVNEAIASFGGSTVVADRVDFTGFGGSDAVQIFNGGMVTVTNATGSPTFNVTGNQVTDNGLIITDEEPSWPDYSLTAAGGVDWHVTRWPDGGIEMYTSNKVTYTHEDSVSLTVDLTFPVELVDINYFVGVQIDGAVGALRGVYSTAQLSEATTGFTAALLSDGAFSSGDTVTGRIKVTGRWK